MNQRANVILPNQLPSQSLLHHQQLQPANKA
jgi:hypothetical protein